MDKIVLLPLLNFISNEKFIITPQQHLMSHFG